MPHRVDRERRAVGEGVAIVRRLTVLARLAEARVEELQIGCGDRQRLLGVRGERAVRIRPGVGPARAESFEVDLRERIEVDQPHPSPLVISVCGATRPGCARPRRIAQGIAPPASLLDAFPTLQYKGDMKASATWLATGLTALLLTRAGEGFCRH